MSKQAETIHILHVDDDPSFLDVVATFLEREDDRIEVETATNPEDGLEMLTDHSVDCIVSDYDLPHQNGIEFLEAIREEYPALPFILYTGKGSEEVAADAISAGVSDYLQKEGGNSQYTVLANRVKNAVEQYRGKRELKRKDRAMDAAPVGITISGPIEDDTPLIYVNDRFTELTGHMTDDILGSNCRMLQGENTDTEPVTQIREAIDAAEPVTAELKNYRKDGTEFWNRVSISPVRNDSGEVTNYVGFQQDITEAKERQQQLETVEEYRREIYQITSDAEMTPDEKITRLLTVGCEFLDLENGRVS